MHVTLDQDGHHVSLQVALRTGTNDMNEEFLHLDCLTWHNVSGSRQDSQSGA